MNNENCQEGNGTDSMTDVENSASISVSLKRLPDEQLLAVDSFDEVLASDSRDDDDKKNGLSKSVSSTDEEDDDDSAQQDDVGEDKPSLSDKLCKFWWQNDFLILVVICISLARAYPPLGADYLAPEITADWIAVCLIFLLAGMGLDTSEFAKAFKTIWFNLYVQGFNFGFVSAFVFVVSRGLLAANILSQDLADGLVVTSCLPMSINMVIVLTTLSNGDESLSIVNAAASNMIGVFLSPVLIVGYIGVKGDIDMVQVFYKLAVRVAVPVFLGQLLRNLIPQLAVFYGRNIFFFKRVAEYALVYIVYSVFCITFEDGRSDTSLLDIFLMILCVFFFLTFFSLSSWFSVGYLFKDQPEMRVMGLFGCTHKTIAMGIPVIKAIYGNTSTAGVYTLPILCWHPMQLMIGTFLAPRLAAYIERERKRLDELERDRKSVV